MIRSIRPNRGPLATLALVAVVAAACQPTRAPRVDDAAAPAAFPVAAYRRLAADGPVYVLRPERSSIRSFVYRGGPLAQMGHNHVVAVPDFRGAALLPEDLSAGRFDLVFRAEDLAVDRPADREGLAGAFGSRPDADAVAGTRANMLGTDVLAAEHWPRVALHSTSVDGELPVLALGLRVQLHGETAELTFPVRIQRADERLVAEGQFRLRQTRFGIEPFSAAGGAQQVRDTLAVRFRLVGERREKPFPEGTELPE